MDPYGQAQILAVHRLIETRDDGNRQCLPRFKTVDRFEPRSRVFRVCVQYDITLIELRDPWHIRRHRAWILNSVLREGAIENLMPHALQCLAVSKESVMASEGV